MKQFNMNPEEFHAHISNILQSTGYTTENNRSIHGAQVDIVATRQNAPIPEIYYLEVTMQKVDVVKYGKDATKFALIQRKKPNAHCIIISLKGFAERTRERAEETGVHCWTYTEFRQRFLPTSAYENYVLGPPDDFVRSNAPIDPNAALPLWQELRNLEKVYQEPTVICKPQGEKDRFKIGALKWLDKWIATPERNWISLTGDYGTGKTALTKMLLLRWMRRFQSDGKFLPIRIELKDFATKFDFEGLLIYFWNKQRLTSLPIDALQLLVDEGRVIFILDGYDEMAQNLSVMDRRNCLTALAKALSGRSTGIITSRPNYFTEAEELRVVELLYKRGAHIHRLDKKLALEESQIDGFLSQYYYDRNECRLIDLSPGQIQSLLEARLENRQELLSTVRNILDKIYALNSDGAIETNLGNKPVVVTYLLEVAENLGDVQMGDYEPMDEWGIYRLILDRLVYRDQHRTSGMVTPGQRRDFLQRLAVTLSMSRRKPVATKGEMLQVVHALFGKEIQRYGHHEIATQEDLYFADLRSSASLTSSNEEWSFSHNSLREFLTAEAFVETLEAMATGRERWHVRLRDFSSIRLTQGITNFLSAYFRRNPQLISHATIAAGAEPESVLNLMLPVAASLPSLNAGELLHKLIPSKKLDGVFVADWNSDKQKIEDMSFEDVIFDRCSFVGAMFERCRFDNCIFNSCDFRGAELSECCINKAEFDGVILEKNNFHRTSFEGNSWKAIRWRERLISDDDARAYIRYHNGEIASDSTLNVLQFHPRWGDFVKVIRQLVGERWFRQELGLTQKGSVRDVKWVKRLVDVLVRKGWCVREKRSNVLIRCSAEHFEDMKQFELGIVPDFVRKLFK